MDDTMIGEILDGKYRIDRQLGAGGMGNVYLATHLGTTRVVAVKVIAPRWAAQSQFLARFQREAQACGRLRHPNIINVTDFGVARMSGGDMPYLVMELLDGETLSDFQKNQPQPGLPLIADLLDQIGLALEEAHKSGIVHRDLKPDNIWLEPDGRGGYGVKVLDFGVAKVNLLGNYVPSPRAPFVGGAAHTGIVRTPLPADSMETAAMEIAPEPAHPTPVEDTETVAIASPPSGASEGSFDGGAAAHTMPGSLVGTPAYMSPEQALGMEIDFRSDIYSLAVVAYSLVCGQLPFTGKSSPSDLVAFHQAGMPASPSSVKRVPRDVSDAVMAGLARNPDDRPQSAVAFTRRFHNAVDAEFLALRRSKAFLLQHFLAFALVMLPLYSVVLTVAALLASFGNKVLPAPAVIVLVPCISAALFIFSDNVLRAAAALMAIDERVRIRRFLSFRVSWRLVKMIPALAATQARSVLYAGPGWVIGDCLWPVIAVVENLRGNAALDRSRSLMRGLRSAGRALAIRHLALAALAIADVIKALGVLLRSGQLKQPNVVIDATWFPIFAVFAGAPLFLYDRTAADEVGPLLQLNRTPEVRTTVGAFSLSSRVWIAAGLIYLLYQPLRLWLGGG